MSDKVNKAYDESSIQVLEGLEAVRKRPGMYIGSTGERGLHHLVWEIVDNSVDEALAGHCDTINISILEGNIIEVSDNGRGIPVGIHKQTGKSTLETIFTVLHAGGKFGGGGYKVSGGLHGVGASVVNALSEYLEVYVHKDGQLHYQKYEQGEPVDVTKVIDTTTKTGTTVRFKPDATVFTDTQVYSYETIMNRTQELAFLNRGITFNLFDQRDGREKEEVFVYEGGIIEYVKYLNEGKTLLHEDVLFFDGIEDEISVEVAMQYTTSYSSSIYSYANNINTHEGGYHETGFRTGLTRILNNYAKANGLFKKDENLTGEDIKEGITAIISIKHPDPQFEGQTKTKLGNSEVRKIVDHIFSAGLERFLNEKPGEAKRIIEKALMSLRARLAAKKARDLTRRKSPLDSLGIAAKLSDCHCKDPSESEIFIVEGDSAGGSAKQGRNSHFQAILPLRGKVLNVEKKHLNKALGNKEIISMIQSIGTGIGEEFDIEKAKYHKIVIMTDADVDGAHIRTLLLTFFFRFMRPLIEYGYVYIAQPPLYKIAQGKKVLYAYSDAELEEKLSNLTGSKPMIQRYKGLGEMNAEQLWETTMDPEVRTMLQVSLDNAKEADQVFSMLMGDDVLPRKQFIQENAQYVKNLDI